MPFVKGHKTNVGRKYSEDRNKKISLAHKGKKCPWLIGNTHGFKKGNVPWNKGLKGFMKGDKNGTWKGGKIYNGTGYVWILCENHPVTSFGNYVFEHRLVMEKRIGRYLKPEEIVHHINGIRDDNRIENLKLTTRRAHPSMHIKKGILK
jgi:hypothetical protein